MTLRKEVLMQKPLKAALAATLVMLLMAGTGGNRARAAGQWAGMKGTLDFRVGSIYGTQGIDNSANLPGTRERAVSWTDASGALWLFGGWGRTGKSLGDLNDLWKYDPVTGNWTWMKGASTAAQSGIYGTLGIPDPANTPGARDSAVSWTDASGALWLFGGENYRNDLWKYDPATGNWTWMKGASTTNQSGTYGTLGVAEAANTPGARRFAVSWTDASGMLWLFGGEGYDGAGSLGDLNDLWKYDPATGNWTWMKGASTRNQMGTCGTRGVAAAANTPGARERAGSCTDASGMLWLFGGWGYDRAGNEGGLNDLWKFDPATGNWTWMKGDSTTYQSGIYGTRGVAAAANTPGARECAVAWTDASGGLWLFGGYGYSASDLGSLNDLWKYDPATNNWTWMKGALTAYQSGNYGTLGLAAAANTPGARRYTVSWTDASGAMWLFGGKGYDGAGNSGWLNDLWKYNQETGNWTWMKGASMIAQRGTYGTLGVAAPANSPGERYAAASWSDSSGALWLFGGNGRDGTTGIGYLNDLWKYDPATGNWRWMKGASTTNQSGTYGTQRVAAAGNTPGARDEAVSWTDASESLWLFGGYGYDGATSSGYLNDLWKYNPSTGNWKWVKGASTRNQRGTYGTLGVAAAANTPGAREGAVAWNDASGALWLFGGFGYDGTGGLGRLNDLWKWDLATGKWTWMKGASTQGQKGTYGTRGVGAAANTPGARYDAVSWTDASGTLWLFGGNIREGTQYSSYLNDLWKYDPSTGNWTWMKGASTSDQKGTYGTRGVAAAANTPGARYEAVSGVDGAGALWLFGGTGYSTEGFRRLNDLWKYDPSTGNWTWMKGASTGDQRGTCMAPGVAATDNTPGARNEAVSWTSPSGGLWIFGGVGHDCGDYCTDLGDLWRLTVEPESSARKWSVYY